MNGDPLWLIDNIHAGTKLLSKKTLQHSDAEQQMDEQKDEIDYSDCVILHMWKKLIENLIYLQQIESSPFISQKNNFGEFTCSFTSFSRS